jgi:signal transduction histidine kinase
VTIFTSLTINRPVRQLIAQTEQIAAGDGTAPIERPVTHEFAQLSESFADMALTLQDRNDYIKTFASNVSHEFKTPLASIRGTVELLHDHLDEMTDEERDRFLGILLADAERLERLVRRLLELARADVLRPDASRSDAAEIVRAQLTRYQEEELDIELQEQPGDKSVRINRETLESILSNLIENARQHGGAEVQVQLKCNLEPRDASSAGEEEDSEQGVAIWVIDDGPGVSTNNARRIFDAFFTTARASGGTGLGLSVVRSLIVAHGGEIQLLEQEQGATFRIWLPRAPQEEQNPVVR